MNRFAIARAASAGVVLAALAVAPASAQEGDVIRGLLSAIGLTEPERPPIEYRERPPLVVPPNLGALPPPASGDVAAANPAWPNDPDVAAARAAAIEASRPAIERVDRLADPGRRLSPDELRRVRLESGEVVDLRLPGGGNPVGRGDYVGDMGDTNRISPQRLREIDEFYRGQAAETRLQRRFLTDPPQAYLLPDPNAPLPEAPQGRPGLAAPPSAAEFARDRDQR